MVLCMIFYLIIVQLKKKIFLIFMNIELLRIIYKKMFVILLTSIVSFSNSTKCISLSNQKFMTQPTVINLNTNEYSQELRW